uniref:Uncharacterized protein n=1 Tax=Tanacetum cinerariifolium TaxID=118510 RepID=A0A699QH09_TANCI|nr:hypothetical protein [Tanacetum cinerariifolium]
MKEALTDIISSMEKAHSLEKSAIKMDIENKGCVLLELRKKVDDLNAQNYKAAEEEFERLNEERKKGDGEDDNDGCGDDTKTEAPRDNSISA